MSDSFIAPTGDPQRLDRLLVQAGVVSSRARARRAIASGKVTIDGAGTTQPGAMIAAGATVEVHWSRPGTAPDKVKAARGLDRAGLSILYEDEHLLALDKPAGLLTDTATREQARTRDSLRKRAQAYLKAHGKRAFVVHRIDRDTTGVVLLAKDEPTAQHLRTQFRNRSPTRLYDAVVEGHLPRKEQAWVDVMAWHPGRRIQELVPEDHDKAFRARCDVRELQAGRRATRIEVALTTGRRNQIRLQAMVRDLPLVGERLYRTEHQRPLNHPKLGRQALHARQLSVIHPATQKPVSIEAPLPRDYRNLLDTLGVREDRRR